MNRFMDFVACCLVSGAILVLIYVVFKNRDLEQRVTYLESLAEKIAPLLSQK